MNPLQKLQETLKKATSKKRIREKNEYGVLEPEEYEPLLRPAFDEGIQKVKAGTHFVNLSGNGRADGDLLQRLILIVS